jgi:membrane-associated protein
VLPVDLQTFVTTVGPIGVALIVFAETGLMVGFFLPGDSMLFTAGFLASPGVHVFSIWLLSLLAALAAVLGDSTGYAIGRAMGPRLFAREDSRLFRRQHLQTAHAFYERHGGVAIVLGQFMPIVRTFCPVAAGLGQMSYPRFFSFNLLAALLWGFGVPWLGFFLGSVIPDVERYLLPIIALIIVISLAPSAIHAWHQRARRRG